MRIENPALIPDHIAALMSAKDRAHYKVKFPEERIAAIAAGTEKALQVMCENWLTLNGYRRRTPEEIKRPGPITGWFIHIHKAQRNPIILDLLILFQDGRYVEIELKTSTGEPSPEQEALIARGGKLCRSLVEFISIMLESKNA